MITKLWYLETWSTNKHDMITMPKDHYVQRVTIPSLNDHNSQCHSCLLFVYNALVPNHNVHRLQHLVFNNIRFKWSQH